ncbi:pilus assembly protein [Trinickia terrae]|uniref:Pilus assembly protein n=1 Tax=Trinickia terrae TaxID=2571161 RepID=A0A4U1ICG9_9BURK|nr:pilus assembly protein [Trinickia terrae]TKC91125.1 pilus assembly protein [Trinickia terrae]
MMLATSAAWLETSTANLRRTANMHDYLQAFHAADGVLALCTRALRAGVAPVMPAVEQEPVEWRRRNTFDGPFAFTPRTPWPGSARAPQCLIEAWQLASRPHVQAYLLTARGFGAAEATQAWLQREIVFEEGAMTEIHWRRIVARPS